LTILDEILNKVPKDAQITSTGYESANIVLYTKNKSFFIHGGDIVRQLVEDFKKRVDLRADSSLRKDAVTAEKMIKKILPKSADIVNIIFEPARGLVTLESKNPGKAIGKDGDNLKEIKESTFWIPVVVRESSIPSDITKNIRKVLYDDSNARQAFLNKVGERIYETNKSGGKEMWARLSMLGGSRQVGRSAFLLQTPESKVLIDCGVNVAASGTDSFPILTAPEFDIQDLDAVIISHAHLDHSGFLPYLFKYGYDGPVYCTAPTRDIMALLQLDYIDVMQSQAKKAIFSSTEVKKAVKNTITLEFGEVTDITPDVRITLYNAGHIIGSSLVHLHLGEGWHNILYTGDYKLKETKLLNPAHTKFPRVETFITESTYGGPDDFMEPREKSEKELVDFVHKIIKRKGKVLVPVLGVGRAQEVMIILEKALRKSKIPIYIDGMVWDVTTITGAYPEYLNSEIRQKVFYKNKDPFLSKTFKRVGSQKERLKLLEGKPCVILATSGMLVGGPSVSYLKALADQKKNGIVFVSYQGEGSLGRRIQNGEKNVRVDNEDCKINLSVLTIPGLSGHSDRGELVSYVDKMDPTPRRILIVHGDNQKCLNLGSTYHKEFKVETTAPRNLDAIRLR